jgi:hypothetical protein
MKWIKKGLIYEPSKKYSWAQSHAQVPVAHLIQEEKKIRIYFASRNSNAQSLPTFIDVSSDDPGNILYEHVTPLLELGKPGTFDDCGIIPSWIIEINGDLFLYYIGWNVRNTVPYYNSVGLAISKDGGMTFTKFSEGPLWDRNYIEPYFSATTCVLKEENGMYRNWYLSCIGYSEWNGKMEPLYHIKYCESNNGIDWQRIGKVAIDFKSKDEAGIVKASVIKKNGKYYMWYAFRNLDNYRTNLNNSYRIGYAKSLNGIDWDRDDENAGIDISKNGWDSQMLCYPHVIEVNEYLYMFYNGNGFGKTGFGYAMLENSNFDR